jgi:integrase
MRKRKDNDLPPCVYRRGSGFYLVKRNKWTLLGHDMAAALAEYGRIMSAPAGGMPELIENAFPAIVRGRSEATRAAYRAAANRLADIFRDFSPAQVKPKHVAAMRRAFEDRPATANLLMAVMSLVMGWAVEEQLIDSNPVMGLKRAKAVKRGRFLTDRELDAIRAQADDILGVIIDLCFLTGQRIGDVLGIRLADLTEDGIAFKQAKTGARLIVGWSPDLRATVDRAKAMRGPVTGLTLLSGRGGKPIPYHRVLRAWTAACEAAGVADAHIHDLRAKSLTEARRQGVDPTALAGHSSASMTERYIRDRDVPVVSGPAMRRKS